MKRFLTLFLLAAVAAVGVYAQRMTDQLDRGLVAVKTAKGVYCSWRITGEEYYDVTYNLYRDGTKVNAEPLLVSNYTDKDGTEASQYTVKAVVRGTEQAESKAAAVWAHNYLEIKMNHGSLKSTYVPNDACCADVDGDGEVEILLKFDNLSEIQASYPKNGYNGEYSIAEVYKLNGKKLWWLDFGPNMGDFQNNEQNIVAYDWDEDGRAEAVMRAADGTTIHAADGQTYVIGDKTKNYRGATGGGTNWFMHDGAEYLVYMEGATGVPYVTMDYPLKRLETGETDLNAAWGDGYGHRSSKHFFGAPYLDGRHPSIFLARGIYTRHKMIAYDVDPATHQLNVRWRWSNNTAGSQWFGQGYHNYAVADVDWDGRDEICFGSMVIDDNGHGLSTTGLGHGDAQHHGDFNPYLHGQEIFACNEDNPGNNYRDATTSKIYYRYSAGNDDGRSMMGNFSNNFPGCQGVSSRDPGLISSVINGPLTGGSKSNITQNFRIYWDGDLCEETHDYTEGKNTAIGIWKYGLGKIEALTGSLTNNDTKGTPSYQGDLFGDWREEVIARTAQNNIRIYTTTIETPWRNYTLWHDLQYRQAMVWQMCGYNQPPHVSYFLGELEGITQAPPALTTTGRKEIGNGGTISAADNDTQLLLAETQDMTVSVSEGASPYILFDNAPSWVQGHDNNNKIEYTYYTHTLTGSAFTGAMRLVKQGDGALTLPNVEQTYSGDTELWAGTLNFDGTMAKSHVWMNRFAKLNSDGGRFLNGIDMSYASVLRPGGQDKVGTVEVNTLRLGFGARVVFDLNGDGTCDNLKAGTISIEKKYWKNGPKYNTPILELVPHYAEGATALPGGRYVLATAETLEGSIDNLVLEGLPLQKHRLTWENGELALEIEEMRAPAEIVWDGGDVGLWDLANTESFLSADGNKSLFVSGDTVVFNDNAQLTMVFVEGELTPGGVVFDSSRDYQLLGSGSIIGKAALTKKGTGNLSINNINKMTGGINLNGGKLIISALANADGTEYGALGGTANPLNFGGGTLAVNKTLVASHPLTIAQGGGTVELPSGVQLTLNGNISGAKQRLTKTGSGTLVLGGSARYGALYVNQGVVKGGENGSSVHQYADTVVINGGTLRDPDNIYSYSSNKALIVVPEGAKGIWTLDSRCDYTGKLIGGGELTVNVTSVRCTMKGDWSQFAGTLTFINQKTGSYDPQIVWDNGYGLGKATVTGTFHNSDRAINIGRLTGNVTLTGSGRYTVKGIDATINRVRGSNTNTLVNVSNALSVTGDITVKLNGTSIKAGESITLWKAGSFQGTSATINLPELPAGLAWDTTDLLKATGVLRVVEASAVRNVRLNGRDADAVYTLDGQRIDTPKKKGIYIKNGKKIVIK